MLQVVNTKKITVIIANKIHEPNLGGGRTLVTRAGPGETVATINQPFAVRGIIRVAHLREVFAENGGPQVRDVECKDGVVGAVAAAGKYQIFAIRAPAVRDVGSR